MRKFKRRVLEDPEPELDLDEEDYEDEDEGELDEDDYEEDEDEEDEEEEEEEDEEESWSPPLRRRPAFRRSRAFMYDDDEDEELSEEMAAAIRAGQYKPQKSDPWSAHLLYNVLKDTGKI